MNIVKYAKDSVRELKHVVWPNRKETNKYFTSTLGFIIVFSLYLFVASTAFTALMKLLEKYI